MHLIVISSYWPRPDQPNPAFFEVDQVRAFAELGHQVDVLIQVAPWQRKYRFLDQDDLGLDPLKVGLVQIIMPRFPEPLSRNAAGIIANQHATGWRMRAWLAAREAKYGSADAVIVHGERNVGVSAGLWNRGRRLRSVCIIHGADPVLEALSETTAHRHLASSVNTGFDRVILVGNRLRNYAVRLGYETGRTIVIPNGFRHPPTPTVSPAEPTGPVRLAVAARLVRVKGIDDVLLALANVRKAQPELDWCFSIIGDGPERAALETLSARLDLQDRVQFHGSLPHHEVLSHLEKSAVFVMPSWNEAFGLAYLEAMTMGCAVIGCFENGAADIVTDRIDGRLVPPRDVESLAQVLSELVMDTKQREALSSAAKESVKRFSWPANARAVIEALDG